MANISETVMTISAHWPRHHVVQLTKLHLDIIFWLARGFTYANIACKINYSSSTVHNNLLHLYSETKSGNEASLVSWAYVNGVLIKDPEHGYKINEALIIKKPPPK